MFVGSASKRRARLSSGLLALVVLLVACGAVAEPLRLPEITVEASPMDPYLPARTEIDRSEIIDSHKSELSDVLELTPGINVRQGGRGEVRVDLRGFDQRATLFTLNGVPVYEPYNGVINADVFPLEMLGGIEVSRGISSSLYGPNGMAGQIKLNTLAPRAPLGGALSTIWRADDLWDVRASGSAVHEGLSAVIAGRYLESPNFNLADGFTDRPGGIQNSSTRLNSDIERFSGLASIGYEYGDGGRVHLAVLGTDSSFGEPPSTTQFEPMFLRVDPQRLLHVQAGVDQRILPSVGVAASVFYTTYDYHESQYTAPDFDTLLVTSKTDSSEIGGIGRITADLGDRDSLAIGGQVRGDSVDISNTVRGFINNPAVTVASIGVENVYAATDQLSLVLGISDDLLTGGRIGTRSEVNPQGIVSMDFGAWGATRVAVGRKIRFPTLRELFEPGRGNENLAPEHTLTYEIGHRLARDWGYAALNLFRSDVSDLINPGGEDQTSENLQDATLQGLEVAGGVRPVQRVQLDVTYTFLDTSAHNNGPLGGSAESAVQHKPEHRFNGILQLALPWALWLRMEGLYTSSQLDQFGSVVTVPEFAVWNVQVTRPFGTWLSLFAGADNLLDANYEQKLGAPEPGRREFVGFRASY